MGDVDAREGQATASVTKSTTDHCGGDEDGNGDDPGDEGREQVEGEGGLVAMSMETTTAGELTSGMNTLTTIGLTTAAVPRHFQARSLFDG